MKVKIEGWIVRYQPLWKSEPWYWFTGGEKPRGGEDSIPLFPHTFEVEVPDGEMIAERVAGIREAKQEVHLEAAKRIVALDEFEQKLLCLTNEVVG
jgi:hypothetical protein